MADEDVESPEERDQIYRELVEADNSTKNGPFFTLDETFAKAKRCAAEYKLLSDQMRT